MSAIMVVQTAAVVVLALTGVYLGSLVVERLRTGAALGRMLETQRSQLRQQVGALRLQRTIERETQELSWNGFRKFVIDRKVPEGGDVCSFYLRPHDGRRLPTFKPGQFLTFRLTVGAERRQIIRCYSLSDSPGKDYYRVSIKKVPPPPDRPDLPGGASSSHFHDALKEGDILDVKAPSGGFFLDLQHTRPVVLIGGGIGITPVLSMLNAIVEAGQQRETWFFFGARSGEHHVFKDHLARIAKEHPQIRLNVCYSNPTERDRPVSDYHHVGHVSVDLFKQVLPSNNYEFYFCGPPPMMNKIAEGLEGWGVPTAAIHYEAFGPATVKKVTQAVAPETQAPAAAGTAGIPVTFARSGKSCEWKPGSGTLLELAEAQGIRIDSGCRAGNCGTCITAVKSGKVTYPSDPGFVIEPGSCLVCVGLPKDAVTLDA